MAQNNFHVRILSPDNEVIASAMRRYRGDNGMASALAWVKSMGFKDEPIVETTSLGRKTPVVGLEFSVFRVEIIPVLDEKFQCPTCGHPKDAPNFGCFDPEGCQAFINEEPENVIDLDEAQAQLRKMFS